MELFGVEMSPEDLKKFEEWNKGKTYVVEPNGKIKDVTKEMEAGEKEMAEKMAKMEALRAKKAPSSDSIDSFNKLCAICIMGGARPLMEARKYPGAYATNDIVFVVDNGDNERCDVINFSYSDVISPNIRQVLLNKIDRVFDLSNVNKDGKASTLDDRLEEVSNKVYEIYQRFGDFSSDKIRKLRDVENADYFANLDAYGYSMEDFISACQTDIRNLSKGGRHSAKEAMYLRLASARAAQVALLQNPETVHLVYPKQYRTTQNDVSKIVDAKVDEITKKIYIEKFSPNAKNFGEAVK